MSNPVEKVYYQNGGTIVTSQRAEFAGKTYAMANITSVSMSRKENPKSGGCLVVVLYVVALLLLIGGVPGYRWTTDRYILIVLGLIALGLGIALTIKYFKAPRTYTYFVNLTSASGESQAMSSKSETEIAVVVDAIRQAIIERDALAASAPPPAAAPAASVKDKLAQLKDLLDAGLITQAEYDRKRADLLAAL